MQTRRSLLATLPALAAAGCSTPVGSARESAGGSGESGDAGTDASTPERQTMTGPSTPPVQSEYWYTHPQPTGNRTLTGAGNVRDAAPVAFEPAGKPQWLVAHPADEGSHWTVVTDDGRATRWRVADGAASLEAEYGALSPDTQPVVATGDADPRLVRPPGDMAAMASPVVAPGGEDKPSKLLYLAENGDLVVAGEDRDRLPVDGLPDGRLAAVGDGRYALFGDTTDRYRHGALGDSIEGETLYVVDPDTPEITASATVGPSAVFEGLQPLAADVDGDGDPEIVTTVADSGDGARIAVFSPDGDRLGTGPIYGPGWRHQLAVAPFSPDGTPEIAVVRKPHVDHTLEFYRHSGNSLDVTATVSGFSTHTYGSRVLSGAVAGDFDDDGTIEALVPRTDRTTLAAVRRSGDGAAVVWEHSLNGPIGSNVTGVSLPDGLAVGLATGGSVSVWQG